jgi:cytochrome d ubiquinol oxidase subunit II
VIAAAVLAVRGRETWAFAATGLAAIGVVATIFTGLYPRVIVSDPAFGNSLTISNAAAGHYALEVITVVAVVFTPIILLYQGWTYHVFRARLGGGDSPGPAERPGEPQAG